MEDTRFDDFARLVSQANSRRSLIGAVATGFSVLVLGNRTASAQSGEPAGDAACVKFLFGSGSATGGLTVTFRVRLTAPAPPGGANVTMAASDSSIPVPANVLVPAGQTEHTFTVSTLGVAANTNVTVSASAGGCIASRIVLIKAPRLRYINAQSVIRGGGQGKVTVCIVGEAPAGGTAISLSSDAPATIASPGDVIIPATKGCLSVVVNAGDVVADVPVQFTASLDGTQMSDSSIVRNFDPICVESGGECNLNDPGACCSLTCINNINEVCDEGLQACCA